MTMRIRTALVAMAAFLLAGCTPEPGATCKAEGKAVCADAKQALACHDGKWEAMACRGASGCAKSGGETRCDQSAVESGDVCNVADDFVCASNKKAMLQCSKRKWTVVESCLGEHACTKEKNEVRCDNSIANADDACLEEGDFACSADKKAALSCKAGHFVSASPCKGRDGCQVVASELGFKVKCDDSIATAGDPCEKDNHYSCSTDEHAILKCKGKKFEVEEKCRGKDKCSVRSGEVGCFGDGPAPAGATGKPTKGS